MSDRRDRSRSDSSAPAASRQAASTRLIPIALLANGTVREARGFDLEDVESPSATASWTFKRPTTPSAGAELADDRVDLGRPAGGQGRRWEHARGVAGVDARLLHVLHDGGDARVFAVAERVDVDLDRVLEEAVDEDAARSRAIAAPDSSGP